MVSFEKNQLIDGSSSERRSYSTLGQMDGLFEATLYGDAWMISWIYYLMLVGWRDSFGNGNLPPQNPKWESYPEKPGSK